MFTSIVKNVHLRRSIQIFQPFSSSALIINEIYASEDTADHHGKYIELYDHGVGSTLLNGFLLVFFDGSDHDRSYYELDLSNRL